MKPSKNGATFGPSAGQGTYPNEHKRWTEYEKKLLMRFRTEGADAISPLLGRSPKAVRRMASKMHVSLRLMPGDMCPICGKFRIRAHTAAARHGMCQACWTKELARLRDDAAEQRRADRLYQAAKKRAQRAGGDK